VTKTKKSSTPKNTPEGTRLVGTYLHRTGKRLQERSKISAGGRVSICPGQHWAGVPEPHAQIKGEDINETKYRKEELSYFGLCLTLRSGKVGLALKGKLFHDLDR